MGQYITAGVIYSYEVYGLTSTNVNTATVEQFITDSEALVDGYLANNYTVPFTTTAVPNLVKKITRDLTGYEILNYLHSKLNRNINNNVLENYKIALEQLSGIASGMIRLVANGSVITENVSGSFGATYKDTPYVVNMDDELCWAVPDNLLTTIDDNRSAAI